MYSEAEAQHVYNLPKFPSLPSLLYPHCSQQLAILYSRPLPGVGDL